MADGSGPRGRVIDIPGPINEVWGNPDGSMRTHLMTSSGLERVRYRVLYGGRGGAKTESIARILIAIARTQKGRALCVRRFQNSIEDSVHKALVDAAEVMGVLHEFRVTRTRIVHRRTGYDFIFKGTQRSLNSIKSIKGVTHLWYEEAQVATAEEWAVIDPTIREENSEVIVSFNPDNVDDATYVKFVLNTPDNAIVKKVNWDDNPWFPAVLEKMRITCKELDELAYDWIWEGNVRKISNAIIFRDRWVVEDFEEQWDAIFHYGVDWGYSTDPTVMTRCYITEETLPDGRVARDLWITHAQYGYNTELDDIGERIFDQVPGSKRWPIKADSAQPAMVSYMSNQNYPITGAEKWPGSVEDGVAFLRGFHCIHIHPRCVGLIQEVKLYSWKVDPRRVDANNQPLVLPVIVDLWNHGWDAIRYSLGDYIESGGGGMGAWAKLGAALNG